VKSRTLDSLAVCSAVLFVASALRLVFYLTWAELDASMEKMWIWKREFYLPLLVASFVVGLPCWVVLIRRRLRKGRQ
jgi:hypothetical protein